MVGILIGTVCEVVVEFHQTILWQAAFVAPYFDAVILAVDTVAKSFDTSECDIQDMCGKKDLEIYSVILGLVPFVVDLSKVRL